jgi:hypothetical protein
MPFSFNPTAQGGGQEGNAQSQEASFAQGNSPDISLTDAPTAPDSPILFLAQRESGNVSVNAYLQMLLILVALVSVIFAVVLFVYGMYLTSQIDNKKERLALEESTFKDYPFDTMKTLSERVNLVDLLLRDYVSIRSPLKLLEDVVENGVYFDNFSLSKEKKGGYTSSFTVITADYQSLIQQLEALKLTQYTKIAPQPKADKFVQDKKQNLTVKVTTPVMVQGVLPDEVVFLPSSETKTTQSQTSLTPAQVDVSSSTVAQ